MNFRWITVTILMILVLGGLISSAYANAIERDLTLPAQLKPRGTQALPTTVPVTPTTMAQPTQPTQPTQQPGQQSATTLAQDTFQRANQALWGTAVDGRAWQGDANTAAIFSIVGGMGQVAGGQGTFNAILGPVSNNTDVVASMTASRFDGGKVNIGAAVRWNDTNNWYKALIDGTHLSLIKHIHGVGQVIASVPFLSQGGVSYTLRVRALGVMLFAKVWPTASPEPASWMITTSDMSLASGQGGIRIVVQNDAIVQVSAFLETVANEAV